MRVLFDDEAFNQPFGGVSKYFAEMIRNLPADCEPFVCQKTTQNLYLQEPPFSYPKATHTQWNFCPWLKMRGKWVLYRFLAQTLHVIPSCEYENHRYFIRKLNEGAFDILHLTNPHVYTFDWVRLVGKKPIVMTIHDLIPDMDSRNKKIRRNRARALRYADRVISVSRNTKNDLVRLYDVDPDKISVIYHGADEIYDTRQHRGPFAGIRYLLYVGGRRGYKNFDFFSKAIVPLLRRSEDFHLVCTGSVLSESELALFRASGVEKRIHSLYVAPEDMQALYSEAFAFIYPSRYEGFGIPILDAFKAGCPVILSRCSCFPEVGGDAALYFDVTSGDDLRNQIYRLINEGGLREKMVNRGRNRVQDFTWLRCAEETARVYREVVQK